MKTWWGIKTQSKSHLWKWKGSDAEIKGAEEKNKVWEDPEWIKRFQQIKKQQNIFFLTVWVTERRIKEAYEHISQSVEILI